MSSKLKVAVLGLWTLLALACTMSAAAEAPYRLLPRRDDDQVKLAIEGERAVVTIVSPRGISGLTIESPRGKWPHLLVLRLHLRGLEGFHVSNGTIRLSAAVLSYGDHVRRLTLSEDGKSQKLGPGHPYWMEIEARDVDGRLLSGLPGEGGYFQMTLPKALLKNQPKTLSIGWIDFYR
jgi:hypothetical protein